MDTVLTVEDLHTHFISRGSIVRAVNGVGFVLERGKVLALMGESGAGKTTTALSIMGLLPSAGKVVRGRVFFDGVDLLKLGHEEMRSLRGREISMMFQEPRESLNPVLSIGTQVEEVILAHQDVPKVVAHRRALELLTEMGLPDPERLLASYPFQLSGGMCQRVALAVAIALRPKVLIADEPTSDLDVTIQAQVLSRLEGLTREFHTSILYITHDLGIVARLADEVVVMYGGCVMERANVRTLFDHCLHPYSWGLLQVFGAMVNKGRLFPLWREGSGELPDVSEQCPFLSRCLKAINECRRESRPPLVEVEPGHWIACYNPIRYP